MQSTVPPYAEGIWHMVYSVYNVAYYSAAFSEFWVRCCSSRCVYRVSSTSIAAANSWICCFLFLMRFPVLKYSLSNVLVWFAISRWRDFKRTRVRVLRTSVWLWVSDCGTRKVKPVCWIHVWQRSRGPTTPIPSLLSKPTALLAWLRELSYSTWASTSVIDAFHCRIIPADCFCYDTHIHVVKFRTAQYNQTNHNKRCVYLYSIIFSIL